MERVILVLGGGGVKGMAHVGAWKALEEAGGEVAEIVGTSIGALVGACIAGGMGWRELAPLAVSLRKRDIVSMNGRSGLLNGIRQQSVFHGERLMEHIRSMLPVERSGELSLPQSMGAVDLDTVGTAVFGAGGRSDVPLADAVYASCALPLFYPPAEIGGQHFVDGGVGDALAVERARDRGADLVVAVDVSAGPVKDSLDTISKGMVAIHHRVFDSMSYSRRPSVLGNSTGPPLLYVRPRLDGISTFDFTRTQYFLEEGYRAMRAAISSRPEVAVAAAD